MNFELYGLYYYDDYGCSELIFVSRNLQTLIDYVLQPRLGAGVHEVVYESDCVKFVNGDNEYYYKVEEVVEI